MKEFKKATTEIEEDIRTAMDEEEPKPTSTAPKQVDSEAAAPATPSEPEESNKA